MGGPSERMMIVKTTSSTTDAGAFGKDTVVNNVIGGSKPGVAFPWPAMFDARSRYED